MRKAVLVVVVGAGASGAWAQDGLFAGSGPDLYISAAGLLSYAEDVNVRSSDSMVDADLGLLGANLNVDSPGYGGLAALGWQQTDWFRTELEYSYRTWDYQELARPGGVGASDNDDDVDGSFLVHAIMVNAFFDWEVADRWTLYAGAGVGGAYHEGELTAVDGVDTNLSTGDDITLAFQYMLGVEYDWTSYLSSYGGFRYFVTEDPDYEFLKGGVESYNLELGLRLRF